jgi:hypothetical protein
MYCTFCLFPEHGMNIESDTWYETRVTEYAYFFFKYCKIMINDQYRISEINRVYPAKPFKHPINNKYTQFGSCPDTKII